jgi:hypothetical protein
LVSLSDKSALFKIKLLAGLICQKAEGEIDKRGME